MVRRQWTPKENGNPVVETISRKESIEMNSKQEGESTLTLNEEKTTTDKRWNIEQILSLITGIFMFTLVVICWSGFIWVELNTTSVQISSNSTLKNATLSVESMTTMSS